MFDRFFVNFKLRKFKPDKAKGDEAPRVTNCGFARLSFLEEYFVEQ